MILLHGDCLEQMKTLPDNSIDAIVSDPPYGISFMAKKWDYDVPSVEVWKEAMRVLKPGGHALIACGTRTQHRMVVNIEDAGFEIRDVVSWIYGSGFPKSLNISKAIDKAAGAEREILGTDESRAKRLVNQMDSSNETGTWQAGKRCTDITAPATEAAKQWDGWGTALKPACEFFTLARKPLSEKTVAANVLKWGTGGINIDGCRVEGVKEGDPMRFTKSKRSTERSFGKGGSDGDKGMFDPKKPIGVEVKQNGRFPANLIHDGSQEVLDLFPETKSGASGKGASTKSGGVFGSGNSVTSEYMPASQGSAARFFYCAKASKKDRDEGLDCEEKECGVKNDSGRGFSEGDPYKKVLKKNNHPTVKPTALMAYLCRLITPAGGTVLDPFMGSGSTGKAAVREGFDFVGCELDADYHAIATARIEAEQNQEPEESDQKELF